MTVAGNFYLLNHPKLMWVTANTTNMMAVAAVASPLKVMGGLFPFFYGRQVQGNVTYLGKVAAGNGFFGEYIADQLIKL